MIKIVIIEAPCKKKKSIANFNFAKFPGLELIGLATNIAEGTAIIRKLKPNLVFLDINLPDGLGFDVFEETKDMDYEKIIFCPNNSYLIKALRYNVADYLSMPVSHDGLKGAIEKLLFARKEYGIQQLYEDQFNKHSLIRLNQLCLSLIGGTGFLNVGDLVRIRDEGEVRVLHLLNNKTIQTRKSVKRLMQILALNDFFRIGKKDVINLLNIDDLVCEPDETIIRLTDGYEIEVPYHLEYVLKEKLAMIAFDEAKARR